jgi:acyl carrier protein
MGTQILDQLMGIWQEVLGRKEICPDDKIMDLGGDSMKLYQICMIARERYKLHITPMDLMIYPTPELLAGHLENPSGGNAVSGAASGESGQNAVRRRRRGKTPGKG